MDESTRSKVNSIIHKKFQIQSRKLNSLIIDSKKVFQNVSNLNKNNQFSNHKFFNRFINLSKTNFTDKETNLLEKGFKYNLPENNSFRNLEILAVETELALKNIPLNLDKKYEAANLIKKEFLKGDSPKQETRLVKDIKLKCKDIIFTKADKGNTVVAVDKAEYLNKTFDFLKLGSFKILKRNPTENFQKSLKSTLHNSQSIISTNEICYLTSMNPQPPKLYSFFKLHKHGYPIRPVVSFISAPSYKVSKKLIHIISENTNFSSRFAIKNSIELVNKIKHLKLPTKAKLISFDVTNLFPSIPIENTILIIENLLTKNNTPFIKKQEILNLLTIVLEQNYFEFDNNIYLGSDGLIMGNPLSPLLAEIFMNSLEEHVSKNPLFKQFIYWYRYVDDILTCFTGTDRQLSQFLTLLNNFHPNIKFTIEEETNRSINFLDLTITNQNGSHMFSIYHKPSYTDTIIPNSSCHPHSHKLAAFHSMIHRLTTIPLSPSDFNKELNIIKQIAYNNGYSPAIVEKLLKKKQYNNCLKMIFPTIRDPHFKFITLTFNGNSSVSISSYLKKLDFKVAFRTNNTLGKLIKNNKTKTNKLEKSGVYKLNCNDCPKTYIGQTGRCFRKRLKEHYSSFINNKLDSNYGIHLQESQHNFNQNFQILHLQNKGQKLNLLEALEINKLKNSQILLNDQLDLNNSPLLNLFTI